MSNPYEQLKQWNELLKNGTITQEEFDVLKAELLGEKKTDIPKEDIPKVIRPVSPKPVQQKKERSWIGKNWIALLLAIVVLVGGYFIFIYDNSTSVYENSDGEIIVDDFNTTPTVQNETLKLDTLINNVNINGTFCTIKVFRGEEDEIGNATITMNITKKGSDKPIYTENFNDNTFYSFNKAQKGLNKQGKLFFRVASSGGAIHYGGDMYLISLANDQIVLKKVMDISDTRFIYFNKNDKDILTMDYNWSNGYWDADYYTLNLHTFDGNKYKKTEVGTTEYEYGLEEFSLTDVYIEEYQLFKDIDISGFVLNVIATHPKVYFYSQPLQEHQMKSYFVKGQSAEVIEMAGDFIKVRFEYKGNVTVGYVLSNDVELVN